MYLKKSYTRQNGGSTLKKNEINNIKVTFRRIDFEIKNIMIIFWSLEIHFYLILEKVQKKENFLREILNEIQI